MKKVITLISCIISFNYALAQVFPVVDLRVSGRKDNRINLVILPDGYTAGEQTNFVGDADTISMRAFNYSPLKEYRNFYNVYCIKVPSKESGIKHPATATDIIESIPKLEVDNYFGSTLDAGGMHRLIVAANSAKVSGVLASNIPDYDQVFVLSNTELYGGSGGLTATGTMHKASVSIAVHEWGHSFAGLVDEYWNGWGAEGINMTANTDPFTVKWKNWMGVKGIGIYPYGTGGDLAKWFRPHQGCAMQYLDTQFCSVCQGAFIDKIYSIVTPIDEIKPDTITTISYSSPLFFTTSLIKPIPNTLLIKWVLNGLNLPLADTFANINGSMLSTGMNELKLIVTDTTGLSRSYWPKAGYQFTKTWKINKTGTGIINVSAAQDAGKFFYKIFPNPAFNQVQFEYENFNEKCKAMYRIVDLSGRVVKSEYVLIENGKNQLYISLEGINEGVYFFTLNGESISVGTQLMVE